MREIEIPHEGKDVRANEAEVHPVALGPAGISKYIKNSIGSMPSVTDVQVTTINGETVVEITVNKFEWKSLEPIYHKEADILNVFASEPISFRVIDDSPLAA